MHTDITTRKLGKSLPLGTLHLRSHRSELTEASNLIRHLHLMFLSHLCLRRRKSILVIQTSFRRIQKCYQLPLHLRYHPLCLLHLPVLSHYCRQLVNPLPSLYHHHRQKHLVISVVLLIQTISSLVHTHRNMLNQTMHILLQLILDSPLHSLHIKQINLIVILKTLCKLVLHQIQHNLRLLWLQKKSNTSD